MSNVWQLIKINLSETLDKRRFKQDKAKFMASSTFLVLFFVGFLLLSGWYSATLYDNYSMLNYDCRIVFFLMSAAGSALVLFSSIFQVKSIFVGKDYDLLRSMPIKKRDIILSKLITLYVVQVIYQFMLIAPACFIGILLYGLDYMMIVVAIVGVFFLPIVPMLMACLIALFLALVVDRFRFRNVITVLFYIVLLVGMFSLSFISGFDESGSVLGGMESMLYAIPSLLIFKLAIFDNLLYLLLLIGISIVLSVGIIMLFVLVYDKAHFIISSHRSNIKYVRKKMKKQGQFKTLLKLEYKRYFSSRVYMMNTLSSGIVSLVFGVVIAIVFYTLKDSLGAEGQDFFNMLRQVMFISTLVTSFMIGIATPAAVSISMEGNNFWITKSLPISYRMLMVVKLITSISILTPFVLIPMTLICILFTPSLFSIAMMYSISIVYIILASSVGLFINLMFPNFKWKNEAECVKRGMAVFVSMILDIAIFIGLAFTMIKLLEVDIYLSGWLSLAYVTGLSILFISLTLGLSKSRLSKFEEF